MKKLLLIIWLFCVPVQAGDIFSVLGSLEDHPEGFGLMQYWDVLAEVEPVDFMPTPDSQVHIAIDITDTWGNVIYTDGKTFNYSPVTTYDHRYAMFEGHWESSPNWQESVPPPLNVELGQGEVIAVFEVRVYAFNTFTIGGQPYLILLEEDVYQFWIKGTRIVWVNSLCPEPNLTMLKDGPRPKS